MIPQFDQEIYDEAFRISLGLNYKTFDYLPAEEETYPFVYIGQTQELPLATKSGIAGELQLTIHIYAEMENRGLISQMKGNLIEQFSRLKETKHFKCALTRNTTQPTTILEQGTNQLPQHRPLWHVIIPLHIKYIPKGV
ncbi:DUF3168 domain-containing protein [Enterococcus faecium]|nr:DUF3168 domain-containing protein [Enterococcus faecium]